MLKGKSLRPAFCGKETILQKRRHNRDTFRLRKLKTTGHKQICSKSSVNRVLQTDGDHSRGRPEASGMEEGNPCGKYLVKLNKQFSPSVLFTYVFSYVRSQLWHARSFIATPQPPSLPASSPERYVCCSPQSPGDSSSSRVRSLHWGHFWCCVLYF